MIVGVVALLAIGLAIAAFRFKYRADEQTGIAENAKKQAETVEQKRTASLFDSQLTHGSLLARVEDYAEARRVLAESRRLDPAIPDARRHARNLLAGYVDLMSGSAEQVYAGASAALVGGVAVSPDGKLLAAAGERATLVLFDSASGRLLRQLPGHDAKAGQVGAVNSVVIDPKGRWLFSGGEDARIIRWSLPAGEKLGEWKAPGRVTALALSPDGAILASGGDRDITLWSVPNGKRIRTLEGHIDAINSPFGVQFSSNGKLLGSASWDKTARIWDVESGKSLGVLEGHTDQVVGIAFSPHDKLVATASGDRSLAIWDAATGRPLRQLRGHQNIVFGVTFSADGNQLLSASRDNTLRLWDVASGVTRRIYQGHEAGLWSVARYGDDVLYTASNDATVRRWSLATPGQWVWETGAFPQAAAISPDGRMVAMSLKDGGLRLYGLPEGQVLGGVDDAHEIMRIAFNANGSLLATSSHDKSAKLWRVEGTAENGKLTLVHTFQGHSGSVHAVAFSPDGRTLATASYDGKVGLFDVTSGTGRLFEAHEGRVASV